MTIDHSTSFAVTYGDESVKIQRAIVGDANLDGFFNSSDLVALFVAGEYEDGIEQNSIWSSGDWNGDAEFNSSDLIVAFRGGEYEQSASVQTVPEPGAGLIGMVLPMLFLATAIRSKISNTCETSVPADD